MGEAALEGGTTRSCSGPRADAPGQTLHPQRPSPSSLPLDRRGTQAWPPVRPQWLGVTLARGGGARVENHSELALGVVASAARRVALAAGVTGVLAQGVSRPLYSRR